MKKIFCLVLALLLVTIAYAETYETTEDIPLNAPDEHVVITEWPDRLVDTPELQIPGTLDEWTAQRAGIRDMIIDTLGNIPPRPEAPEVEVYETGETPIMTFEKFYMNDAYGDNVPGTIYIPRELDGKAPAILYLHYHGDEFETGQNEVLFSWPLADDGQPLVDEFIKRGYVVMAIDAYAFTTRSGQGPGYDPNTGEKETGLAEEASLYKYFTVQGISYMGMIIRDDQCALDYLTSRPEVDAERIGITGMSMGGTRANWLAALDERVKVTVSVACLTRMQDFIKTGNIKWHAFFNWVPGMLARFDTEQVVSLIAPRNYVQLMGTEDIGSPVTGVRYIEEKMKEVYKLYGAEDNLEFHYYEGLDHDYLPEEFELMLDYFDGHL
ncbi:MAG: dienelactone hydrolase family protein [Clostridia bacterium]|nr:dienelactone hydrolase family protein [Clostridia bacterium]